MINRPKKITLGEMRASAPPNSLNARSMAGCRTGPIRSRASVRSTPPERIRRRDFPRDAEAAVADVLDGISDTCPECLTLGA